MELKYQIQAAVVGGDSRQIAVAEALKAYVANVKIYGHSRENLSQGLDYGDQLETVLSQVKVVILPIGGMNDAGMVWSYQGAPMIDFGKYFDSLPEGTILLTGSLTPKWLKIAAELGFKVYQYAEDDAIAILNSIPTAEGTVQMAMEKLPITIHGSNTIVIGGGRVGITVARTFKALGSRVTVVARREAVLARALEMGCEAVQYGSFSDILDSAQLIINTVPTMVLDRTLLNRVAKDALIIDLASAPGGTDFGVAQELGIQAVLAPGLPGIVAPKTAGAILASAIPKLMLDFLQEGVASDAIYRA